MEISPTNSDKPLPSSYFSPLCSGVGPIAAARAAAAAAAASIAAQRIAAANAAIAASKPPLLPHPQGPVVPLMSLETSDGKEERSAEALE